MTVASAVAVAAAALVQACSVLEGAACQSAVDDVVAASHASEVEVVVGAAQVSEEDVVGATQVSDEEEEEEACWTAALTFQLSVDEVVVAAASEEEVGVQAASSDEDVVDVQAAASDVEVVAAAASEVVVVVDPEDESEPYHQFPVRTCPKRSGGSAHCIRREEGEAGEGRRRTPTLSSAKSLNRPGERSRPPSGHLRNSRRRGKRVRVCLFFFRTNGELSEGGTHVGHSS